MTHEKPAVLAGRGVENGMRNKEVFLTQLVVWKCERCGQQYTAPATNTTFPPNWNVTGVIISFGDHRFTLICNQCVIALQDFLRPIPQEAKPKETERM